MQVGCGRYAGRHAILHYEQLGHQYAMELESQRVWDYGGDQYVHRLIQNRPDGRLVELPSTLSSRDKLEGQSKGGLGPGVEDNLAQTKLERMSEEFAHLLATQLDSQRHYYFDKISDLKQSAMTEITVLEEELEQQKALLERHNAREGHLQAESSRMAEERTRLEARIREVESTLLPALEKEKARLSSKLEKAAEARATLLRDLEAEKQVTRGLMDNVTGARLQLKEAHDQNIKMKTEVRLRFVAQLL
jgi:BRCA1-associated protein